jgi:hypothetical protein
MAKFNLSEAAKEILQASVAGKKGGADKPQKLGTDVAYGNKDVGDIGTEVTKTTDGAPAATKGVPQAKAPGATPPVGSQPASKLTGQPGQSGSVEQPEGKTGGQAMQKNKNGVGIQSYGGQKNEELDADGNVIEEEEHEDAAADKKMIKAEMRKEKQKERMKEDIDALLDGESLSEEFVTKATTIFEAAVIARAEEVIAEAEAEMQEQFQAAVEEVKEDLATKVDDYLNYMAEEWVKENKIAIEKGLRAEIVEDFIAGLKDLFTEHYIDIPEEKVDVVEELTTRVEELQDSLNEQIKTTVQMKKELNEHKKFEAIQTVCEGLTQTQVEKLKQLAESVEFTTEEEFTGKLETLKESYFKATVKSAESSSLNEEIEIEEEKKPASTDSMMNMYAQTISKTLK